MKAVQAAITILLLFSACLAYAQDDSLEWTAQWRNGQSWKMMPREMKAGYVMGIAEAIGNMAPAWGDQIGRCRCSTAEMVAGIDSVYARDNAYLKLPVMEAMSLFLGHATGDDWQKVDLGAQNWLKVLANDNNSQPLIPASIGGDSPLPCPPATKKPSRRKP